MKAAPRQAVKDPQQLIERALEAWRQAGRTATFWWRDDDAALPHEGLERLLRLRAELEVPLALAVVPARLEAGVATAIRNEEELWVLQHGFDHRNRAEENHKSSEFPPTTEAADAVARLRRGRELLAEAFAGSFLPVLVPPWNRFDEPLRRQLPTAGLRGISAMWPRPVPAADSLIEVNCHLDPVEWHRPPGRDSRFIGGWRAAAMAARHLQARLAGRVDSEEPTGLLTHHAVFDQDCWDFCRDLIALVKQDPGARWLSPAELFGPGAGGNQGNHRDR